ncbi:hypothetical protein C7D72_19505 [Klebsiella pneumoniae]|nr:hypothetical protein C7D72_19505 [Klebsiella pneumoniae]
MFIFEGNEIETDSEGYLKDTTQWSEAMAEVIAAQEGITLAVEHWEVVRFVREFYLEFNTSPAIRMRGDGGSHCRAGRDNARR